MLVGELARALGVHGEASSMAASFTYYVYGCMLVCGPHFVPLASKLCTKVALRRVAHDLRDSLKHDLGPCQGLSGVSPELEAATCQTSLSSQSLFQPT